jgi:exodeoxyribonuclease VII large subunit
MVIESMEIAGTGALLKLLEERKKAFAAEGLFDVIHKKPIPFLPKTIGVVTSASGAVIRDIIHRVRDRFPSHILLIPTPVQGEGAAEKIAQAIKDFNRLDEISNHDKPDVLIVARGGGSLEDLWPFNEECVIRAVFASQIPIISAVGHETDFTIADFVADLRAPTPSAAAEIVCPDSYELCSYLENTQKRLKSLLINNLETKKAKLERLSSSYAFLRFKDTLDSKRQMVDDLVNDALIFINNTLKEKKNSLSQHTAKLDALSPLKVLSRGYSLATDNEGNLIYSVKDAVSEKEFTLKLSDGNARAKFI